MTRAASSHQETIFGPLAQVASAAEAGAALESREGALAFSPRKANTGLFESVPAVSVWHITNWKVRVWVSSKEELYYVGSFSGPQIFFENPACFMQSSY